MKQRVLSALVAAVTFTIPLWWTLGTAIPYRIQKQLVASEEKEPRTAFQIPELSYLRTADGEATYRQRLLVRGLPDLLRHPEIRLLVANYGNPRTIRAAELSIPAGNCGYDARPGARFPNNDVVLLVRHQACLPVSTTSPPDAVLSFRLSNPGPIALWTSSATNDPTVAIQLLAIAAGVSQREPRAVVGTVGETDYSRTATRLALLNDVWQVSQSAWWLVGVIGAATMLIGFSAFVLADRSVLDGVAGSRRRSYSTFGAFSSALALSIAYACVIPPFQAADESHHFAGLAVFLGTPGLADEATRLARLGHVDRIKFHATQHFNPSDVGNPDTTVETGVPPEGDLRGRGIFAVWSLFAPILRHRSVGTTLFLARVLNGVVFATAMGLLVYLTATFSPNNWPILNAFSLFIVPTLPFFGMAVSNYAPLCAAYIVIAAGVLIIVWDGRESWAAGPLLGGAWAAAMLLSRSALPLAPLILSCAVARLALHRRGQRDSSAKIVAFWAGLSLPSALAIAALPIPLAGIAENAIGDLPTPVRAALAVAGLPWIIGGAGLAAAVLQIVSNRFSEQRDRPAGELTAWLARSGAVLVGLSMAISIFISYPTAPGADQAHVSTPGRYVLQVLFAGLTIFRFGHADFMTSASFWSGFGWLDTFLPEWTVTALAVSTGAALIITLSWIARARPPRTGPYFFFLMGGLIAAFAFAAFGVIRALPASLHGRYLVGIYVCMVSLCWHFLGRISGGMSPRRRVFVLAACGLVSVAIHTFSVTTILDRYFG